MQAGALRHRLSIAAVSRGRDALNGVSETVGASVTVWGALEPVADQEHFDQARFAIRPTHRATIRGPRSESLHRARLTWRGRVFDVVGVSDASERQDGTKLELLCVARTPAPAPTPAP